MRLQWLNGLALLAGGCSAVVAGVEPPECMTNEQCAVLNQTEGIAPDACELYQCSSDTRRCVFQVRDADRDGLIAPECAAIDPSLPVDCNDEFAGGMETCNGVDDDCDGVIDERFVLEGTETYPLPAMPPESLVSVGGVERIGRVGYGAGVGTVAMAHTIDGTASFGLVSGESALGPQTLEYARATSLTSLSDRTLATGCHVVRSDGTIGSGSCGFADIDFGVTEETVFTAAVSTSGCGDGQLRVGFIDRASAADGEVVERGPAHRSNVFAGVDVDPTATGGLACTGASRASGTVGAARPSLAALDASGPRDQALAVWLAAPADRDGCGGEAVEVEALALMLEQEASGETRWVTGSNDGVPQSLGSTPGGGRPAVAVFGGTGYLVAFPAEGGGIALRFVGAAERPPAYDPTSDPNAARPTPPVTVTDLGTLPTPAPAEDVALAFGSNRVGGVDVGLSWRQGCGTTEQTVWFRQIFLSREGDVISLDPSLALEPVELSTAPSPEAGPPSLVYTFQGLLAPGTSRADGRPTATEENDGGWIVAWSDASAQDPGPVDDRRILARRVSEIDGALLSPDELLTLHPPGDRRRVRPQLYRTEDDQVEYLFFESGETAAFRGGALTCLPVGN